MPPAVQSGMDTSDWRYFHGFRLNLRTGELRNGDLPVPLERQPSLTLVRLIAGSGQLVTREDLRHAVWGGDTHVDFDRGLNYCLRQVRLALGDDAREPRFVETVPRQGYRFIAPISSQAVSGIHRPWRRKAALAAAVVAVVGAWAVEAGPRNEVHHRVAVTLARTIHDFLF
jgi:DNA-binding winged helix-turn-helix (wHTH) protein